MTANPPRRSMPPTIFTVDVEEWFHANYDDQPIEPGLTDDRVEAQTECLLDLLEGAGDSTATFFVLGDTARSHPRIVEQIAGRGHEIASHNLSHDRIDRMEIGEFRRQCRESKALLEDLAQREVLGFRAPSWSVGSGSTPWLWDELHAAGYRYSSSVFPFGTFLYGDSRAPRVANRQGGIWEIPPSTAVVMGRRIPFSGGFYLRVCPSWLIAALAGRLYEAGESVMYYIHPRELDAEQPRLRLSPTNRVIHYTGLRGTRAKLQRVLSRTPVASIAAGQLPRLEAGLP
jgi:polysaccharide deacetylase family protein (PEP-CTERM system associated)